MTAAAPWPTRLLIHALLIAASLVVLVPMAWVLKMAFTPGGGTGLDFDVSSLSLDNFRRILAETDADGRALFFRQLFNSLWIAAWTALLGVSFSCTAAFALSRLDFPGRQLGLRGFLVSQMFPGCVMAVPLYLILDTLGLVDQALGLILVHASQAVPFSVFMLKGYFDRIPRELDEVAALEGAGPWLYFRKVALPMAAPGVAVTALFAFMAAWNEYILAATFLNDEARYTLPVALKRYVGPYSTEWGLFAAGSLAVSLPAILLFYALQRRMVQGLASGAAKG